MAFPVIKTHLEISYWCEKNIRGTWNANTLLDSISLNMEFIESEDQNENENIDEIEDYVQLEKMMFTSKETSD